MARIDPWAQEFCLPDPQPVSRTLQAAGCPDFPITLRKLDELEEAAALDRRDDYEARYVTRREPLLLANGYRPRMSRSMCHNIAVLEAMQVPAEGEEPYTLADWIGIARNLRPIWRELLRFSNEVQAGDAEGN